VYVDDIIVTGNNDASMQSVIGKLQLDFAMKDLGSLSYFLGIQTTRDSTGIHLRQSKYIQDLLNRAGMIDSKPYRNPCISGSKMSKHDGDLLPNPSDFRQLIGALQYATLTRPDIAYSVNQLYQHMQAPTSVHSTAAKRVLRYLKGTLDFGLHYTKGSFTLHGFSDSDWASNPDDRRSTTGYGIFFGSNLISWSAKKQTVVSRSSTKAKYRAMAITTADLYWLRMLFKELQLPLPSPLTIWCDNSGSLDIASNPVSHARTKHIEVDVHFIREKVLNKDIQLRYLSTIDQLADIFTKGLPADRFSFLRDKLPVIPPLSLRGGVKDIIVNSHHIPAAASTISSSLMDSTQTLDQSAVNQGKLPQQSHTQILSPYKTYS